MNATLDNVVDPLSTKDPELYLNTVVSIAGFPYGVVLLRIYDDIFLTSAGYSVNIILPEEPVSVAEFDDVICYHAVAATELPTDFMKLKCIATCSLQLLYEADPIIVQALMTGNDISRDMLTLSSVELDDAYEIAKASKPEVLADEQRSEYRVFVTDDGNHWSWILLFPEKYFN